MSAKIPSWNLESIFPWIMGKYGDYLKHYTLGMLYVKLNFEYHCFYGQMHSKFPNLPKNFWNTNDINVEIDYIKNEHSLLVYMFIFLVLLNIFEY